MKYRIITFIAAFMLVGCSSDNTMDLTVDSKTVTWKNSVIEFSTPRDYSEASPDNPGFRVSVITQKGKRIEMPTDDIGTGYGASFPKGDMGFYKPENGIEKAEILDITDDRMVILLTYAPWNIYDAPVRLNKQITLYKNNPVMKVYDYYTGPFDMLNVTAGLTTALEGKAQRTDNGFLIHYPSGITSVIVMPDCDDMYEDEILGEVLIEKKIISDSPLVYYVGLSDKGENYLLEQLDKIL